MTLGKPLRAAPPGRLSPTAKRSFARALGLLLLVASLLAPASASAAEPKGCGYGTGGPKATTLCWLDMTAYSDTQARSADGQEMSVELPGGYTISFTIKSRPGGAIAQRAVASAKLPTNGSASYIGNLAYVGIPGKPALYTGTGAGGSITTLSLSNIQVKDSSGQAVSGYAFVGADAENTSSAESITWTSDQPIYQVASLSPGAGANGCQNHVSGLGTTSVTCTGNPSPAGGTYGTVIVAADTPTTFSQSLYTAGGSNREAVAFALMTSKIQVTKSVVGRVRASDSFDISATSPEGSTIGSATTGSADSATTGEITVLPRDNGASYTLSEAATPASGTRPSDYSRSWSCTNNGVAEPSLPSGGEASVSVSPEAGDFISCTVTNTQLPADLVLAKSVNQETAVTGDELTYTLQVENQGPSGADTTTLIDSLPAGLAYVSDDAGCDTSALPTIECDLGTLLSGESRSVEIVAEVQPAAAGSLLLNTAEVGALQPDSEPSDNEAEASTAVAPFADLAIVKSVSPQVVSSPGEEVTYTLEVENKGEGDSSSTIVADTLPSGLAYVSDTGGCDVSALPTIECDLGELANGATKTVQIVAEVEPSVAGQLIENTASVSGSTFDPEPKNNESTATVEAEPLSDLAITKTKSGADTARPGENVTYFLTAENKGPTTDNFVTVTDSLPPELEYVSDNGACDTSALPKISCEVGMQEKGKQNTITVIAKVLATSGTIENTAEVSGANPDAKPANNKSSATVSVEPVSDLSIEKTVSAPSAKPGEQLTYTLEVENKGPSTSDPTTVTDDLPAGLSYVSDDAGCEATKLGEISCSLGSMAAGATRSIEVVAIVAGSATGTLENTAEVTGPHVDPEPLDNESSATTSVEEVADLAVEKTASAPAVKPGEQLTYTLEVENKGPSTSPATVTDTLPANLTYVSDDAGCDASALPQISCDLGPLSSGAGATIEIVAEVKADASGTVENTAEVEGPHADPTPADNESTATSSITPLVSDLALTKSAPGVAVKAGDQITYTLIASNQGPDPSPQTVLTDTLPPQLTYVSDDAGCDTSALPEIECELGTLADGESHTVHIVTRVTATDGQPIQNKARVSGANPDPEPGNNPDAAQVPLAPVASPPPTSPPVVSPPPASKPPKKQNRKGTPRLTLTKTASSNRARPGAVISYRITVANRGDAPARGVEVCDHPPASQRTLRTEPRATGEAKPCWRVAKLAPGAERSFTLTAMVEPGSDRGTQRNRATVTAANVKGVRADTAGVRVKPLPQTGCLARPLGGLAGVEFLC